MMRECARVSFCVLPACICARLLNKRAKSGDGHLENAHSGRTALQVFRQACWKKPQGAGNKSLGIESSLERQAGADGLRLIVGPWARPYRLAFDFVVFVLDFSGPYVGLVGLACRGIFTPVGYFGPLRLFRKAGIWPLLASNSRI